MNFECCYKHEYLLLLQLRSAVVGKQAWRMTQSCNQAKVDMTAEMLTVQNCDRRFEPKTKTSFCFWFSHSRAKWVERSWKGTIGAGEGNVFLKSVNSDVSMETAGRLTVQSCGIEAHLIPLGSSLFSKTQQTLHAEGEVKLQPRSVMGNFKQQHMYRTLQFSLHFI